LHDHTSSDDRGDTEFHQSTSVGGKDNSHPVERITSGGVGDTVEGDLAADKVDEEDGSGPEGTSLEGSVLMVRIFLI
jgi:hypothetical protein